MQAPSSSAALATADQEVQAGAAPEWRVIPGLTPYADALEAMAARAEAIATGEAGELIWLIEHPPLYTAGTSADPAELFNAEGLPVFDAGRGGRYTYHGPGQRVGYLMIDLNKRGRDVRRFVHSLENWLIATLAEFGVTAFSVPDRIGIWTRRRDGVEAKIGAIGVRVRKWVTMHGFAINLAPKLSHFAGIVPCGITQYPVTSLDELGVSIGNEQFDLALKRGLNPFLFSLGAGDEKA